jgi:Uma2 family endonuclease
MTTTTAAPISEAEYLSTAYELDCEYQYGVLIERNVGEQDHSWLEAALGAWFFRRRKLWNIEVYTAQTVRLRDGKYMIPDVCVTQGPRPAERIFTSPPLIWIEILSREDRLIRVNEKISQVLDFGVPNVWVIDPETLEAEIYTSQGRRKINDGVLRVEGTPIEVRLHDLDKD